MNIRYSILMKWIIPYFCVDDGDVLTVDSVLDRFENRVEVRGAVYREGLYQLSGEVNTVKQLIKSMPKVRGDAFLNRAVISREYDDLTREMIAIDLKGLLNGVVADIPLQKNDILFIPSVQDLRKKPQLLFMVRLLIRVLIYMRTR